MSNYESKSNRPSQSKLTFESLVPFAFIGILFGLLYNSFFYPHTLVEYAEAGTISNA
jgi:hypothetical protein